MSTGSRESTGGGDTNLNWSNSGQFPGTMQLEGKSAGAQESSTADRGNAGGVEAWRVRCWHGPCGSGANQSQQEDIIRRCFLQTSLLAAPQRKNRRGSKARKPFRRQLHSIPISSAWCIIQSHIQLNEYRRLCRGADVKAVVSCTGLQGG